MNKGLFFLKIVVLVTLGVLAVGFVTMFLWNWLVPELFNGPIITYWQALGLLVLSKLIFSGFSGKRHGHGQSPYWKYRFYEKFKNMPAEQREEFKRKMKDKWCRIERNPSDEKSDASNV